MDLEDNLSLMDRVKLKRSKSKELRLIQQAMEEEEKVARLKKRLERRRRRAEIKNSDQEMIQKRNEQLISECANKTEDFKETVNFNNSGLIHVKCISPVNNVNVASKAELTESQQVISSTPPSTQLKRRGRKRSRRSPADEVQVLHSPELERLDVTQRLSSKSQGTEFVPLKGLTQSRPRKRLDEDEDEEEASLCGATQLLDIINQESQLPTTPMTRRVTKKRILEVATNSNLLFCQFNDMKAMCFLHESSVRLSLFKDYSFQCEIGPFILKRLFKNPFMIFSTERISVKEFVTDGKQIIEHSFSVLCEGGMFKDLVTSTESIVFIKETEDIQGLISQKLSEAKVMVAHNVNNNSIVSLIHYTEEELKVQHVVSIPGSAQQIIQVHGCDNLVIFVTSNNLFIWNFEKRKCVQVIKMDKTLSIVGAMSTSTDNIVIWQHLKESVLALSVLTSSGMRRLKSIDCDMEFKKMAKIHLLDVKKNKMMFVVDDKLMILTWTVSKESPFEIDVISKFEKFPLFHL